MGNTKSDGATSIVGIYVASIAIALLLSFLIGGFTIYYSNAYTYSTASALPKTLPIALTNIFNGYSEEVQLLSDHSTSYIMLHLSDIKLESMGNAESAASALLLAVLSMAMFDFFDKEYNSGRRYNYAGAAGLFASFFIALIVSQYVTSCYFYCNGGSLSGISLFLVDSSATTLIFTSLSLSSIIAAYSTQKNKNLIKPMELVAMLMICSFMILVPLGFLSFALGIGSSVGLPISTYSAHELGLINFYAFFMLVYVFFSRAKSRR